MAIWRAANLQKDVYLTIIVVRKCWVELMLLMSSIPFAIANGID